MPMPNLCSFSVTNPAECGARTTADGRLRDLNLREMLRRSPPLRDAAALRAEVETLAERIRGRVRGQAVEPIRTGRRR